MGPKIAIVADWLTTFGGAESVIESFSRLYPEAPLFTTVAVPGQMKSLGDHAGIRTSSLQMLPEFLRKRHPFLLPFLPAAIESLDLSGFDIVLSSSSFVGKGAITGPSQLHICYCHSPTRYLWGRWQEYLDHFPLPSPLKKLLPRTLTGLRTWDRLAATRPDAYWANSDYIADGIRKYYRRSAKVIPPPVEIERFAPGLAEPKQDFYLGLGRLVPQKKFGLLVEAFSRMPEKKLVIAGTGRNEAVLKKAAAGIRNIEFIGFVADAEVPKLLGRARALLFPQLEDAGITALEALAAGTPVIAYGKGGAKTTLVDGQTGVFFEHQTAENLIEAIDRFEQMESVFDRVDLKRHAEKFCRKRFEQTIRETVATEWEKFEAGG